MAVAACEHDTAVCRPPALRAVPVQPRRAPSRAPRRSPARVRTSRAVFRRRRVVATLLALVAAALVVAVAGPPAPGSSPPPEPVVVVVGPGDTLWDLALPHVPAGVHPTSYAAQVAADNEVDPRYLEPGTVLRLPAG